MLQACLIWSAISAKFPFPSPKACMIEQLFPKLIGYSFPEENNWFCEVSVSVCSILDGQTAQRSKSDLERFSNMVRWRGTRILRRANNVLLPNSTSISWSERTWPHRQLKFICFRPGEMGVYLVVDDASSWMSVRHTNGLKRCLWIIMIVWDGHGIILFFRWTE